MFLKKLLLKSMCCIGRRKTQPASPLEAWAALFEQIRRFFKHKKVLEVSTPLLATSSIPDPNIQSLIVTEDSTGYLLNPPLYLQTSPEFAMKKLLASGAPSIYQICKAFRAGEMGALHNLEFTMLEWYRIDFSLDDLMDDMDELLQELLQTKKAERVSYSKIFERELGIDPTNATCEVLKERARQNNLTVIGLEDDDRDGWLNLLLSHLIEPKLGQNRPTFVFDFPASQAALAKLAPYDKNLARRFEVYVNGIELANGFEELTDSKEQRTRFLKNLGKRVALGQKTIPLDEPFLATLDKMPACSGVALGLDRLLLIKTGKKSLVELDCLVNI